MMHKKNEKSYGNAKRKNRHFKYITSYNVTNARDRNEMKKCFSWHMTNKRTEAKNVP